jgi:hypothetical protein
VVLVVWDVAADQEVRRVAAQCPTPVAQKDGRFRRIVKRRLLGEGSNSIWLTATDVRTRVKAGPDRVALDVAEFGDYTNDITAFNQAATTFAAILTPHRVEIDIVPVGGESGADYIKRASDRARLMVDAIREKPWYGGDLSGRVDALRAFFATADSQMTAAALHQLASLPGRVDTLWLRGANVDSLRFTETPAGAIDPNAPNVALVVFDLATPNDIASVAAQCPAPVAQAGGRLQQILAQSKTPGVAEVRIQPAVWLQEVLAAEGGES